MTEIEVDAVSESHTSSKGTTSQNHAPPSEEESPTEFAVEYEIGACNGNGDSQSTLCHNLWRIALYYIYIEMTPAQVQEHIDVQRQACEELGLKGRVRVSQEGVNGVLSGKYDVLRIYEKKISSALCELEKEDEGTNPKFEGATEVEHAITDNCNNEVEDNNIIDLDVKYCELRDDLPIQKQLFDRLIVKKTKNVIGLFDQSLEQEQQRQQQKSLKSERYRRRRERKRQEQEAKRQIKIEMQQETEPETQQSSSPTNSSIPTNKEMESENDGNEICDKQKAPSASPSLDMSALYRSVMETPLKPARHLSGIEWNKKLDDVASSDKSALLLDVRNVYEMKVGHFIHPSTPTLLTNTRKYSDLPQLLASNEEMQKRDQIFMYCTGGVRCERVSMLVHELYPEKEIFQLQGGIQRYLETCSEENQQQNHSTKKNPGYFVGKNFVSVDIYVQPKLCLKNICSDLTRKMLSFVQNQVFDPRRTDPIHFGETVGQCLICKSPHDDYDNGHAPSENREARCNNCRMLILICNSCRKNYRCHGEKDDSVNGDGDKTQQLTSSGSSRPLLYCNVNSCVHEGSMPVAELLTSASDGC